jgi:uncharacterized OB-fold protein
MTPAAQSDGETISREFRPFFEALTRRRISFPRCATCGKFHWYPMGSCPHCRSNTIEWREIAGGATLFSWTAVHYPFPADPPKALPYIVGLVEFAEAPGVRLITNIVDARSEQLFEDMPLLPLINLTPQPTLTFKPQPAPGAASKPPG